MPASFRKRQSSVRVITIIQLAAVQRNVIQIEPALENRDGLRCGGMWCCK